MKPGAQVSHYAISSIDDAIGTIRDAADRSDPTVLHRDIATEGGCPATVDQRAVLDQRLVGHEILGCSGKMVGPAGLEPATTPL